jgi:bacteriorhodopsin|tara:strand:- start:370 stop:1164 length:795 start_codon:yes stop_codon:yes gene_type:complete
MEEMSMTMKALQAGLSAEGVTMYLFWLGIVGMGAGSLYLFMMQSALSATYKKVAIVAGIICAVACFHYYRMSTIYVESLANAITIAEDGSVSIGELAAFPTAYRYIDWLITVPLMVLEFPLLLALGRRANGMFYSLGGISLAMLITAWIAEVSPISSGQWWGFYLVSCACWVVMVSMLYGQVTKAASHLPAEFQDNLKCMKTFIAVGWIIYPIGFLLALSGNESIREIAYNVADVINKVGFGVACVIAAKTLSSLESEGKLQAA